MAAIIESHRFPFVSLEKAVERAKQIYDGDPRGNDMSVPTAFTLWKYSEKSSGGNQTISALKGYGLLVDSGSNEARRVRLTKEALSYFRDEREDVRDSFLSRFALSPALLNSLWKDWGAQPPSDTVARSHLKVDRHLSEQSARSLLGIYKDNLAFAKLTGGGKFQEPDREIEQNGSGQKANVGDYVRWSGGGFDPSDKPQRVAWVSEDGTYLRVHGSPTGIPMSEINLAEAPTSEKPVIPPITGVLGREDITVLLKGKRLEITADVDKAGIAKLKDVLAKYEEILKLLES